MQIKSITLELMVYNVDNTVSFYQQVLGFQLIAMEDDENLPYWCLMQKGSFLLSLKRADRLKSEMEYFSEMDIGSSTALVFQVDDLEAYYEEVQKACQLLNHPHLTPCGNTQFSMKDNNGYVITFERPNK